MSVTLAARAPERHAPGAVPLLAAERYLQALEALAA